MCSDRRIILLSFLAFIIVVGCASINEISDEDIKALEINEEKLLIWRLTVTVEDDPQEIFNLNWSVSVATAGFESGGHYRKLERHRFFSKKTRDRGWMWLSAPTGARYLVFSPIGSFNNRNDDVRALSMPQLRVDVDASDAPIVYVGTVNLNVAPPSIWSGVDLTSMNVTISEESDDAAAVVAEVLPQFADIQTKLLKPHEGPVRF